ncbi:ATP-dependent DNA helicase [Methanofollis formosanus]|uniref:ATP-dependent DNA helicase n=1 Tax=Methanofollis formosanus TaxID=299308 RepID=A0A8G1EGQ5_9EURY|nr:ATP-dependent DNA helicase [Methanofollis formosanus]QYZ80040.1 ATP-dependent DNA helicase [Methanofollis formosanus]
MDPLEDWFPYPSFRPNQREMLEFAAETARDGGIAMIDAPTGSGKSSVVSALLAARGRKRVVVAVRTISQLATFIRELELVRKVKPTLTFAYLVGKSSMCPLGGEGDPYRRCEAVKAFSSSLMREQAHKGSLVPTEDKVIKEQIRKMDPEHPLICPYFIKSRVFVKDSEEAGLRMGPSGALRDRANRVRREGIPPESLNAFCRGLCPYETMMQAARGADVLICNFHHLFNDDVRDQLYANLDIEPEDVLLLIDEAHNCGDVVEGIQSVVLEARVLEGTMTELAHLSKNMKSVNAVRQILPNVSRFMEDLKRSPKDEDWFDPAIFHRMAIKGSLYKGLEEVVEDLSRIAERVSEKNKNAGIYKESAVEQFSEFMYRVYRAGADPTFLTLYRSSEGVVELEVRNIDPSGKMREICEAHAGAVLISGTLSPLDAYRKYFFGDVEVRTQSLPNSFPRENRLLACADDVTTAYRMRRDPKNTERIVGYIRAFAQAPGNLAVYFPSYQLLNTYAEACGSRVNGKKVYVEPREAGEATAALREFVGLPERGKAGILFAVCGGKWSEGLDYRGEMLRGAMVVGLPLAPYNNVRRMVIDYYKHKFGREGEFISYTLPAINRATQALGRVLRTPEDVGVLVLAEQRFLEQGVRDGLPPWMQQEMERCGLEGFRRLVLQWKGRR